MTKATITRPKRLAKAKPKDNTKAKPDASSIRTFRSAVNFLDSLTNYELVPGVRYTSSNFGIARMSRLLTALEHPEKSYKIVHLAGTKGKGSTAAMVAEMLRGCGMKVGIYTSPHILDIRERIMVDGQMISEGAFAKGIAVVAGVTTKAKVAKPTYFELLTALALQYFASQKVDVAVIETGMGGRLDATNAITPDIVGITSISFDHMDQLGRDLVSIAKEKAGIIKKGIPVVSAPQRPSVKEVLEAAAEEASAPIRFSNEVGDYSYRFEFSRTSGRHARICLTTPTSRFEHLHVPLPGEHQALNLSLALSMLDVLKSRGFPIDDQRAMKGLANVNLPGRMDIICEDPRILVDGAHNAASIDALMRAIGQNVPYDSMVVIFGCQKNKDIPGMIRHLQLGADKMIFTTTGSPRSADPAELAALYIENSGKMVQVAKTLDDAMQIATGAISREDLICITGSFYLVAKAIRKYKKS